MTRSVRLLAAAVILLGGCGSGVPAGAPTTSAAAGGGGSGHSTASSPSSSGSARPVPTRLTPEDDGGLFTMPDGTTTTLRVTDPTAPDPTVVGESVLVVPVVNVTDSGASEWELRAVAPGTTTVTGHAPDYTLTLTVP